MSSINARAGEYSLATGEPAVRRLNALHQVYAPAGRRVLLQAGLVPGMHVADFGCGVGVVTRMLAEMVGPSGHVTGVDISADLFARLGPTRGLDYSMSRNLYHVVREAGFPSVEIEIHQPAVARGDARFLLKWSIDEAGPGCVAAGLLSKDDLDQTLADMQRDTEDEQLLVLMPPMSQVWARKPAS
jgi:hypothetical protein